MQPTQSHKALEILALSKAMVLACYTLIENLPREEKTVLTQYIRSAAVKAHLKIAQAVVKKKKRRKKLIRSAQNALVVINAAVEVIIEVGFAKEEDAHKAMKLCTSCYQKLTDLKKRK